MTEHTYDIMACLFTEWNQSLDCEYEFDHIDKVWVHTNGSIKTTRELYYYWLENFNNKWIDVKNKLPGIQGRYLALDGTNGCVYCILFLITDTYKCWQTEWIQDTDGDITDIVYNSFITHWLPLSVLPGLPVKQYFR